MDRPNGSAQWIGRGRHGDKATGPRKKTYVFLIRISDGGSRGALNAHTLWRDFCGTSVMNEQRDKPGLNRRSFMKTVAGRERRLVRLAFAVGGGSECAVHSHTRRAREEGLSADELRHVAALAITTLGFPRAIAALTWIDDIFKKG